MSNESLARKAAERFRQENGLGDQSIANVTRLIETVLGIGVAYVDAPAPGHGMTMAHGQRYLMAACCTPHPMRMRSTLAHELGHIQLGSVDRYLHDWEPGDRSPAEIQADAFARHLLVPLRGVQQFAEGRDITEALLSDLVQEFLAAPAIVTIQMRNLNLIDNDEYEEWKKISSGSLAARFGWRRQYQDLVAQTSKPRAPQALLARAIKGYQWGLISHAAIALLEGNPDHSEVKKEIEEQGIVPYAEVDTRALRPADTGDGLTPEELAYLLDGTS